MLETPDREWENRVRHLAILGIALVHIVCAVAVQAQDDPGVTTIILGDAGSADTPEPKSADEYRWRALRHYADRRYEQALSDFTMSIKLHPDHAPTLAERGDTYLKLNRVDEAIADFNKAIELIPQFTDAYLSRADAYCKTEQYTSCIKGLDIAVNLNPEDTELIRKRSDVQWRVGNYGSALAGYARAFSVGAKSYWSLFTGNLGRVILATLHETLAAYFQWYENYEKVIVHYSAAITYEPFRFPYRYYLRGWAYISVAELDKAVADFSIVLILTPGDDDARRARALAYERQGKHGLAIDDLTALTKAHPDNSGYYVSRAHVLGLAGKHQLAELNLEMAVTLDPESAQVYNGWGYHYLKTGNLEAARRSFEKAIAITPDFWGYSHSAGVYHAYAGDDRGAVREWRRACTIMSEADARYWQRELKRLGHYEGQIDGICGDRMINAFCSCAKARCPF